MSHAFDRLREHDLRRKPCAKWQHYGPELLPLWVADMDFPVADAIKEAVREHLAGDNFGYPPHSGLPGLREALLARLEERYDWRIEADDVLLMSGIVPGLHLGATALAGPGDEVMMQSPIYPPFMSTVRSSGRTPVFNELVETEAGWRIDFDALDAQVTPATRLLMLCNPHNPTGRVFTREELEQLGEFVLRHRLWVVSDELHADLTYGARHLPFAALDPELAQRTLTLYGPTKAFNIAGLKIGFAISQNPRLLERVRTLAQGLVGAPNVMAQAATIAAYTEGDRWLESTLAYLEGNRDRVAAVVANELPGVRMATPEGTYLAWLDFRDSGVDALEPFLLDRARLGLNLGNGYGPGGAGFARLNFATSRAIVDDALERLSAALVDVPAPR